MCAGWAIQECLLWMDVVARRSGLVAVHSWGTEDNSSWMSHKTYNTNHDDRSGSSAVDLCVSCPLCLHWQDFQSTADHPLQRCADP